DPVASRPTFVPDLAGTYVVQLIVNDGALDSAPDTAAITALTVKPPPPTITAPLTAGATVVAGSGAEPSASVQVFVDDVARGDPAIADATGHWSVTNFAPALAPNDSVTARQTVIGVQSDPS